MCVGRPIVCVPCVGTRPRRVNIIDPRFIIGELSSHSALGAHADAHFWPHSAFVDHALFCTFYLRSQPRCEIRIVGRKMSVI